MRTAQDLTVAVDGCTAANSPPLLLRDKGLGYIVTQRRREEGITIHMIYLMRDDGKARMVFRPSGKRR